MSHINNSHHRATNETIYIIDPDTSETQRLESALRPTFAQVRAFDDPKSFLAQCKPIEQGCLIVSALLPGMTVLELIERLEREAIHFPVIVLGEHTDVRLSVDAMRAGVADFIERPFTQRRLRQAVHKAIS